VETERLVWHCTPRAASSAGSSGRRIQIGQIRFLEGRRILCHPMGSWRIGALFAVQRWSH
jgi:hypothetical protein